MTAYADLTRDELLSLKAALEAEYAALAAKGLKLNMARGKPGADQLELSMPMLDILDAKADLFASDGTDTRNYGAVNGIPEARELMGAIAGTPADQTLVLGSSSLNLMFDAVSHAWTFGVCGGTPWGKLPEVKFLCPVPGYDRHFGITQRFGIQMINVPLYDDGPDMDLVEQLVASDAAIKGIWCVPKYANPTGAVYSDQVVRRFAALKPAASDFRIFWDNAYAVHHLYDDGAQILNILDECAAAGNPDLAYVFCSTSKVTFPGSGLAAFASSPANVADFAEMVKWQAVCFDKINQLRHVRFLRDMDGVAEHMRKHAALIRPKFEAVEQTLERELGGLGIGTWTKPRGGYFISFEALPGCAKRIVGLAKDAGVTMTGAGATYPYKKDPNDSNIRIAPTFPSADELAQAAAIFVVCVKLASVCKLLGE